MSANNTSHADAGRVGCAMQDSPGPRQWARTLGLAMEWERFFTPELSQHYARVAIDAAKTSSLRESVRDVAYVYEMHAWFVRNGGGESIAAPFTIRAISELIDHGWMELATWGAGGSPTAIRVGVDELSRIVSGLKDSGPQYLLVPTDKGRRWVAKYKALLNEVHPS